MDIEILNDSDAVARRAAAIIAANARESVAKRGMFTLAVSGGRTPWVMLRDLANQQMPWDRVQVFQVDERIAPAGDPDRNLTHLRESLLSHAPLRPEQIHAMPVEKSPEQGTIEYAKTLEQFCGKPAVLDLVHLGLGPDGHTASLIPGDPVLGVSDREVALTGVYQGRMRMTLTYPMLNRARLVLWLITGGDKVPMLQRLRDGDTSIPAGRIRRTAAVILTDRAAAAQPSGNA